MVYTKYLIRGIIGILSSLFIILPVHAQSITTPTVHDFTLNVPAVTVSNPSAKAMINRTIKRYALQALNAYDQHQPFYLDGNFTYKVTYEDANLLSMIITSSYYLGGAHGTYTQYGLVFDKHTGQQLPLQYFVKVHSMQQIYQGLSQGKLTILTQNLKPFTYDPTFKFAGATIPDNYFLTGDGKVYVIFQPYELSYYANGATRILFTREAIAGYNK